MRSLGLLLLRPPGLPRRLPLRLPVPLSRPHRPQTCSRHRDHGTRRDRICRTSCRPYT
jgi:hypothetical protein